MYKEGKNTSILYGHWHFNDKFKLANMWFYLLLMSVVTNLFIHEYKPAK